MARGTTKFDEVRNAFTYIIGDRLCRYETAQIRLADGTWDDWPDLPIRLHTERQGVLSISWSKFDDLWIRRDDSLPFAIEDAAIRWIENDVPELRGCLGQTIRAAKLGRGQLSIEGTDIEIWTRLLIQLDGCWLEIFNALDENAYKLHHTEPPGEFINCL